jgi:hypothetical protein
MFVLLFAIPFCFSGCSAFTIIHRIQDTKNFELKQVAEQIAVIVKERNTDALTAMMSPNLQNNIPQLSQRIDELFCKIDGQIQTVERNLVQKSSSGGADGGKYFENGFVRLFVQTSNAQYYFSLTYEYYSEITTDDIGICSLSLKSVIQAVSGETDYKEIARIELED